MRCRVRLLRPTPRLAWLLKPSCCTKEEAPCRAEALYVTKPSCTASQFIIALCAGPLLLACRLAIKSRNSLALEQIPAYAEAFCRAIWALAWGDSSGLVRRGIVGCSGHSPAARS